MELALYPKIIFRTPKFSLQDSLQTCWEELKEAIAESSEAFHGIIKDVSFDDIAGLPPNIQHTIWKYYNRSKHRSTPFGTFAAVGICDLSEATPVSNQIIIQPSMHTYRFADWQAKEELTYDFEELQAKNGLLFSNSTYYKCRGNIRYITCHEGKFEITSMEPDGFVLRVLQLCADPTPLDQVIRELLPLCEGTKDAAERITSLIVLQLLFTSLDPNITGEDYFTRLGIPENTSDKHYIISERTCAGGHYHPQNLKHLNGLVNLLRQQLPQPENPRLQAFINRFRDRFDRQEVPLMVALDPEMGVGYGEMEEPAGTDELIARLARNKVAEDADSNPLKDMLSESLSLKTRLQSGTIRLEKLDFDKSDESGKPLPNTFNCLFTEVDGNVLIENLGGVTATALAGRFTLASNAVHSYTREMARIEQEANPDVIFFDIAYIAETEVDNVNRRRQIYDHQLALFSFDTSPLPVTADDIWVSLQGNNLVLRSRTMGKRLIPRLASAYNHSRSDLPVFRLLCDLQYQGLHSALMLRMEEFFPNRRHYPRVQYRNIILSSEKWRISIKDIPEQSTRQLRSHLERLGVASQLRCGVADQILYFDTDDSDDTKALLRYLSQKTELLVEESFLPDNSTMVDTSGKPYASQFMATIVHHHQLYQKIAAPMPHAICDKPRFFPPGSEWLYFELYTRPSQMDGLLCAPIATFLHQHRSLLKKWFFIRYDEGGTHIRLRLELRSRTECQQLIDTLYGLLAAEYTGGMISDIRIRIYNRELERYGADMIDAVERHFCTDSDAVISLLGEHIPIDDRYQWCMSVAESVRNAGLPGVGRHDFFAGTILRSLQGEHHVRPEDFARMNRKYKEYTANRQHSELTISPRKLIGSFLSVLSQCPPERRNALFMDLFHMHVNRLFPSHQRTHELLIYYFMEKRAKAAAYRSSAMLS